VAIESLERSFGRMAGIHLTSIDGQRIRCREMLAAIQDRRNVHYVDALHLAVSVRSSERRRLSAFVKTVLDCEPMKAHQPSWATSRINIHRVTRDLDRAKQWLRDQGER